MINSKDHIMEIEVGSVRAGKSMIRLCEDAEVPYSSWASMKQRVNHGGVISVSICNKLYAALEINNDQRD